MSNAPNKLIALGFAAIGAGYVWELFRDGARQVTPFGSPAGVGGVGAPFGMSADGLRPNLPYAHLEGRRLAGLNRGDDRRISRTTQQIVTDAKGRKVLIVPMSDGVRSVKFYEAGDINNRLKFIIDQMKKDSTDPKTISEATTILSGKCPTARGGLKWCIPVKHWKSEVQMLFFAVTNPNSPYAMRYTRDHATVDMFRSSDLMRRIPAGDCDDFTIRLGAWLRAVGYSVKCRIVAPKGQPGQWAHIYLMVGTPPGENKQWLPLDPTEAQNGPFWEVPGYMISTKKDFEV